MTVIAASPVMARSSTQQHGSVLSKNEKKKKSKNEQNKNATVYLL